MRSALFCSAPAILGLAVMLAACSSADAVPAAGYTGSGGVPKTPDSATVTTPTPGTLDDGSAIDLVTAGDTRLVGGTVTGLVGSVGLRLGSDGDELVVTANGAFRLPTIVRRGDLYVVRVSTQPATQQCTIDKSVGRVGAADVTDVAVTCLPAFAVGGTITGATGPLVLADGDAAPFTAAGNGAFTFPVTVATGKTFAARIVTAPTGQGCAVVAHASGTVTARVSDVAVRCFTPYASCKALHTAMPDVPSGVYPINPAGTTLSAHCDMVNDGGGWTRVVSLRPDTTFQGDLTDAFGDVTLDDRSAKLDDATINALSTLGYFRFDCAAWNGFVKSDSGAWSSLRSNGLTWSSDATRTGDFTCAATRDGYVFGATDGACGGGLAYVSYDIGFEGGGCYTEAAGWYQFGHLWVK